MHRPGVELAISRSRVRRPNHYITEPLEVWQEIELETDKWSVMYVRWERETRHQSPQELLHQLIKLNSWKLDSTYLLAYILRDKCHTPDFCTREDLQSQQKFLLLLLSLLKMPKALLIHNRS